MVLSPTTVVWRGVTFGGSFSSRRMIRSLDGWEELPQSRIDSTPHVWGHGTFASPAWSDARSVILAGTCRSATERDAMLAELGAVMGWGQADYPESLTVTHGGRTLTANAVLARYRAIVDDSWASGRFPWVIEWYCADPMRYGEEDSWDTGFPQIFGGLEWVLFTDGTNLSNVLEWGDPGTATGVVTVSNPGTAVGWAVYTVAGPTPPEGFDILTDGNRLRWKRALQTGQTLVIDSAAGTAYVNGVDQGDALTVREWAPIPAGGSVDVSFVSLGGATGGQLSVSVTPTYW